MTETANATTVANKLTSAFIAIFAVARNVKFVSRNGQSKVVGWHPIYLFPLKIHCRFCRHFRLHGLLRNIEPLAVFHKNRARFHKTKSNVVCDTFRLKFFHPIEVARTCSLQISACKYCITTQFLFQENVCGVFC